MTNTVRKMIQSAVLTAALVLLSIAARASEPPRLFIKLPAGTKIGAIDFKKSKKPAWHCAPVKIGPKGNWNVVSGGATTILDTVPESEDAAEDGTKAIRCQLKMFDRTKHKTANAELGETAG